MSSSYEIPVAHIDDLESINQTIRALNTLHGAEFNFAVKMWNNATTLSSPTHKTVYRFVMQASSAKLKINTGDLVRGLRATNDLLAKSPDETQEPLWPGDVIVTNTEIGDAQISGSGIYFEITTETTDYPAPKATFLRNLPDIPGGCAAYPNAFRREALPPDTCTETDKMGTNRVNEHTLDMRPDRQPRPSKHHHGQVQTPNGLTNHTETALILPRATYGLPLVNNTENGQAIIYRNPIAKGTSDPIQIPVRPGSIIVTPSTKDTVYGHSFTNAFAMLVAVPGFVAPYVLIQD